jgi:hypothetical protein
MKKALKIKFNATTGKRSGDIDPKDPKLQCYGWQDIPEDNPEESYEIRVIEDERDVSEFQGLDGVEVLEGKEAINAAIDSTVPIKYSAANEDALIAEMEADDTEKKPKKGEKLKELHGELKQKDLKALKEKGMPFIHERKPQHIK